MACVPRVRPLLDDLAAATLPATPGRVNPGRGTTASGERGATAPSVPDLGPAVLMDQLTVLVYDACAAAPDPRVLADLAARLGDLRRQLA
nr:hypothetical protein [Pedococcus badiiscoriae]